MEITTELLMCISCLDQNNSFSAFNIDKLLKFAQFYPSDFSEWEFFILKNQLENYRLDMHDNSDFLEVKGIDELSQKLVEKNKLFILWITNYWHWHGYYRWSPLVLKEYFQRWMRWKKNQKIEWEINS
jgi:hypothetical protein